MPKDFCRVCGLPAFYDCGHPRFVEPWDCSDCGEAFERDTLNLCACCSYEICWGCWHTHWKDKDHIDYLAFE